MNAVFYFASNLNGSIVEIVQVIFKHFLVNFKIKSKNLVDVRDLQTVGSMDRPSRIEPKFSNFCWPWSVPRFSEKLMKKQQLPDF